MDNQFEYTEETAAGYREVTPELWVLFVELAWCHLDFLKICPPLVMVQF